MEGEEDDFVYDLYYIYPYLYRLDRDEQANFPTHPKVVRVLIEAVSLLL